MDYPPFDGTQACAGADREVFFRAGINPDHEPALQHCRRCHFVKACLTYALTHDVDGVWGGTTPAQRADIRVQHAIHPHPVALDEEDELLRGGGLRR